MAPRKSSFKRITSNSRKRKNPDSGPSFTDSLIDQFKPVGMGLGSYAATRLIGRIAFRLGRRKSEAAAKHLGPWASVAAALSSAYAADKVEALAPYKTEVVVGAAIAAVQGLLQTYVPQYGWILNDYHLDEIAIPEIAVDAQGRPAPAPRQQRRVASKPSGGQQQQPSSDEIDVDDFSDIPGFDSASFKTGIFS